MLLEDYREKIIKSNEILEILKHCGKNKPIAVYRRTDLVKSWNCLYNKISQLQSIKSTMNTIYNHHSVPNKFKYVNSNCEQLNTRINHKNEKTKENKENRKLIKTININFFEKNEPLPPIVKPAIRISFFSSAKYNKSPGEILSSLNFKRPKKLPLIDLLRIKMDRKRVAEVRNLYFQSSSMSFVPAIAINKSN